MLIYGTVFTMIDYIFRCFLNVIHDIDTYAFYCINGVLAYMPITWASGIALANTGYINFAHAAYLIVCVGIVIKTKISQQARIRDALFNLLGSVICYEVCYGCYKYLKIYRQSPSLVLEPLFNLNTISSLDGIRIFRTDCFFSDTAAALMFISLVISNVVPSLRRRLLCLGALFAMPRLFSGAHWLSDVLVGWAFAWLIYQVVTIYSIQTIRTKLKAFSQSVFIKT